jgi:hypothetical protein
MTNLILRSIKRLNGTMWDKDKAVNYLVHNASNNELYGTKWRKGVENGHSPVYKVFDE